MKTKVRGRELEYSLDKMFKAYNDAGIHAHKNHPCRNFDGRHIAGEPFDYEILYKGVLYAFDAKECAAQRWRLPADQKDLKQLKNLRNLAEHGAESFFLVYFTAEKKLVRFDVETIKDLVCAGHKSVTAAQGTVLPSLNFIGA